MSLFLDSSFQKSSMDHLKEPYTKAKNMIDRVKGLRLFNLLKVRLGTHLAMCVDKSTRILHASRALCTQAGAFRLFSWSWRVIVLQSQLRIKSCFSHKRPKLDPGRLLAGGGGSVGGTTARGSLCGTSRISLPGPAGLAVQSVELGGYLLHAGS